MKKILEKIISKIKQTFFKERLDTSSDSEIIKKDIKRILKSIPTSLSTNLNITKHKAINLILKIRMLPGVLKRLPKNIKFRVSSSLKKKKYRSFRLQKKIKSDKLTLPSAKLLLWSTFKFIGKNYGLILKIMVIHLALYLIFAKTPTTKLSVDEIKQTVNIALGEGSDKTLNGTVATLGTVIGLNTASGSSNIKLSVLIFLVSLVYIWAIRQTSNGHKIQARDAYYQGLSPLISSLIILAIITLQMLPFALVSFVYSVARTGGIFISGVEDMSFFLVTALVGLLSFYYVTSSIIAFYVSTLPGMYPMQAFVSAKKLVQFQRMRVFKRFIALPILILVSYLIALVFFIRAFPSFTLIFNEAFPFIILPIIHTYYYKLYRALI